MYVHNINETKIIYPTLKKWFLVTKKFIKDIEVLIFSYLVLLDISAK